MVRYRHTIIRAQIKNDGDLEIIGKRKQTHISVGKLNVGGLYFLKPGKLYKVLAAETIIEEV